MRCAYCNHFDENDTWGSKCYCTFLRIYVYADDEGCSHHESQSSGGSFCFLTTACCEYRGLPDDCRELTAMRRLRDDYLRSSEEGRRLIAEYYRTAPSIVKRIDASPMCNEIYDYIYGVVCNCVGLVDAGDYEAAKHAYLEMVDRLQELIVQAA